MQPDAPALLWDAHRAAQRIGEFLGDRAFDAYREDILLKSAVERQFEILGEALNRLSRLEDRLGEARDGHREADR